MRILVIEDDPNLKDQIKQSLEDSGYSVDSALDGEEGHFLGDTEPYDAVVLDLGLPKVDGISVLERWRKDKKNFPVLILTARDQWSDKVSGFDAGAAGNTSSKTDITLSQSIGGGASIFAEMSSLTGAGAAAPTNTTSESVIAIGTSVSF